jgi:hypothetical protein
VHIAAVIILASSIVYGIAVYGFTPSVMNNVAFALGHILLIQGFIRYAYRADAPEFDTRDVFADEQPAHPARRATRKPAESESR